MTTRMKDKPLLSDRVSREKDEVITAPPRVDIDRIRFLLDVYHECQEQPAVIKRARLFARLCAEKVIYIDDNPIVGTLTRYKLGALPLPEFGALWMKKVDEFPLTRGKARLDEEEKEWVGRAVDYWQHTNVMSRTRKIMLESRQVDIGSLQKYGLGAEFQTSRPLAPIPDYPRVLNEGLNAIIAEIDRERARLDTGDPEGVSKWYFYEAARESLQGMIRLAERYASLAQAMADVEDDPARRQELASIARTCRWVPANPARDFREALQATWFILLGVWLETNGPLTGPLGRFTHYVYPFFERDAQQGKITEEEVIDLLHFFFLKINQMSPQLAPHGFAYGQSRLGVYLTIGGLTPDGRDATNRLDWLVLEAQRRIRLPEPMLGLIYHDKLSDEFLLKCVELIRTGIGQPSFHDADKAVARHLYHDSMPLEEARNLAVMGCVQSVIPGYSAMAWEGFLNTAKMIEFALNDGKDPNSGMQLGPQTGDPESFRSYEDVFAAVVRQIEHFVPLVRDIARTAWNIARDFPVPFTSALTNDCVKLGKDAVDGGTRYHVGNGTAFVACIDLANSLAAIKKLVFEDRRITMTQLREALKANFKGYEEIQRWCLDVPKYGNDGDYVEPIAKELYEIMGREHQRHPDFLGRPTKPEAFSAAGHFAVGRFTGALPSGREAGISLTDASVSPMPGTDNSGPTALIRSAARTIDTVKYGSNHLNMRFHPSALEGVENGRRFVSMIKTYMDLGGYHVQFNCVSSETLKDAQLHPDNYRDLVVRVAGFSAFFIHLDRGVQDEIIKRTELRLA